MLVIDKKDPQPVRAWGAQYSFYTIRAASTLLVEMLLVPPCRLPWQLACVLFATVSAATISSTNTSTARPNLYDGTLPLADAQGDGNTIAELIPLTQEAAKSVRQTLRVAQLFMR